MEMNDNVSRDAETSPDRRAAAASADEQAASAPDERYRLPRTISPIGLFFGSGAPDPRRAGKARQEGEGGKGSASEAKPVPRRGRAPIGTPRFRVLASMGVTVACGLFYLIILHLPLDPQTPEFWVFLGWLCVVFTACMLFFRGSKGAR